MADFENEPQMSDSEMSDDSSENSSVGIIRKKPLKIIQNDEVDDDDLDISDIDEDSDKEPEDEVEGEGDEGEEQLASIQNQETHGHFEEIDDDDDEEDEDYLKKFDESLNKNIIRDHHPELQIHSYEEIEALCTIVRDERGNIIDPFHKTLPIVTRYEKARVLGERAKQIDAGGAIFVEVEESLIDAYLIALKEFEAKKIPFIVQRPLPDGGCEYWRLSDLEIL